MRAVKKALPKKDHTAKDAKKTKQKKSGKQKAGAGSKPRYSYPDEALRKKKSPAPMQPEEGTPQGEAAPPPPRVPEPFPVDANKFGAQLGISPKTLSRIAGRFQRNQALGGQEGFSRFMGAKLREFNGKHGLDSAYYDRLYESLLQMAA